MKLGDKIEIKTSTKIYKGTFIPSTTKDIFSLKLDNGYNIGIKESEIKSKKIIKTAKSQKPKHSCQLKQDKSLPTIIILHTGGTVASEVSYETGAVTPQFTPEELISKYPEMQKIANIKAELISNIWSEDMNFRDYNHIAKKIKQNINQADGFIITHGTDTMHYTSAALSFILKDLPKPVLLVGSQRSSDRPSADSFLNLYCAAKFIAQTDFADVAICMHSNSSDKSCDIIPGTKARKMHTSKRNAFQSINSRPIAKVYQNKIDFISKYRKRQDTKLKLMPIKENIKIAIIKTRPNMDEKEISFYKKYNGIILEATGLGQIPEKLIKTLKPLAKKIPIAITSQCIHGRINLNVYEKGRNIRQAGLLGHLTDMTPETAYIKLAWLLSNYKNLKEIKTLYQEEIKNEIEPRIIH